ncbi:MAG TPA: response regulator [Bacteroidales bacterium]|nr:response regulator [Bacteroidales bacterium]
MSKLIFFVDDDRMILNLLEYTLNIREDCDVKTFYSGEECIRNLEMNPDLVVLDHVFKGAGDDPMNGLQTLEEIRKRDRDVPVVILTSLEDDGLAEKFIRRGATKFIPKNDFFIDALMETIDNEL